MGNVPRNREELTDHLALSRRSRSFFEGVASHDEVFPVEILVNISFRHNMNMLNSRMRGSRGITCLICDSLFYFHDTITEPDLWKLVNTSHVIYKSHFQSNKNKNVTTIMV